MPRPRKSGPHPADSRADCIKWAGMMLAMLIVSSGAAAQVSGRPAAAAKPQTQGAPSPRPNPTQQLGASAVAQVAPASSPAAAPSAPLRVETVVYDSWTVSCRDTVGGTAKKTCSMSMQVIDQNRGQVLLVWTIGRNNEGNMLTAIQTPSGVLIKKGVELKLGNTAAHKLDYTACEQARCEASGPVDAAMTKDLTAAANATVTIYAVDGRGINFNMPTTGVDKAFA